MTESPPLPVDGPPAHPPVVLTEVFGPAAAAWETSPAAVWLTAGPRHHLVYDNPAARRLVGRLPLGQPLAETFPAGAGLTPEDLDRVLASGRPLIRERRRLGIRDFHQRELPMRQVISPYGRPGERPDGLVVTGIDLSGEARAEVAANRARLLAEVSQRMNAARTARSALQQLTDALVPQLADVAAVLVLPDVEGAQDLRARPGVPEALSVSPGLARLGKPPVTAPLRDPDGWDEAVAAGHPVLIAAEDVEQALAAPDPAARAWLIQAQARKLAVVPLSLAGRLIGALLLICTGDRQPYSEQILPFLTDLAARTGILISQVRQNRIQAQVSQRLQRALLPIAPPPLPGLEVAARYLAGAENLEVGGDWWDVVRLDRSRVAFTVGDVSGKGVEAASVMGHARVAARTASIAGLSPAEVLELVDHELADLLTGSWDRGPSGPQFATCLHGVLDLATEQAVIANAGHLPLLLHHPDTGCRTVTVPPGLPLGMDLAGYTETVLDLPPGTSLLAFTDGLVEDRVQDIDRGLALLAEHLEAHADEDVETCLDKVLAALGVIGPQPPRGADDIAVLLVRRRS